MMAKGYEEFAGFDPRIPGDGVFRISLALMSKVAKAPEAKLLSTYCVAWVLEHPQVVFRGLRTVDAAFGDPREYVSLPDPDGLCFLGVPPNEVLAKARRPSRAGFTFATFVDKRLTVMDWDWIASSRFDEVLPIGWEHRFVEKIWPSH